MDLLAGRSRWGGRLGLCDTTLDQLIHETPTARRLASGALIARLLAVGLHPRWPLLVLPFLDVGQHLAEPLVLYNGRVSDALVLVESPVGQGHALPAHLKPAIGEAVGIDIAARETTRERILLQDDPLAPIGESQLLTHIAL